MGSCIGSMANNLSNLKNKIIVRIYKVDETNNERSGEEKVTYKNSLFPVAGTKMGGAGLWGARGGMLSSNVLLAL